jgi:amidase
MRAQQLDALCAVTSGPACCIDLVAGDYGTGRGFSGPAAMAGYPHITVPMGLVMGLPVGISLVGRAWSEGVLIGMAYSYEQASKKRGVPSLINASNPL